jgi:4-carboxymuconolactone decarboxylase
MKVTARYLVRALLALTILAPTVWGQVFSAPADRQTVTRGSTRVSTAGPTDKFTGEVRVEQLFPPRESAPFSGASVTFAPGARSAWHFHPTGQHLVVTAGEGRTGQADGTVEVIRAGDVVWCPPGVRHWHGAAPETAMTHLAITGMDSGQSVVWLEMVTDAEYQGVRSPLSPQQQAIIPIAAFTATGDLARLREALPAALASGMTINEIKEVMVQMYAYAGFPRTLNALQAFAEVLEERRAKGLLDPPGREASPLPATLNRRDFGAQTRAKITGQAVDASPAGYQLFAPIIDTFLKEHLFADIFARDLLDHPSRELATNAALASMTGTTPQLRGHLYGALNVGLTVAQLRSFVEVVESKVGRREADLVRQLLEEVLKTRAN